MPVSHKRREESAGLAFSVCAEPITEVAEMLLRTVNLIKNVRMFYVIKTFMYMCVYCELGDFRWWKV